ncbi:MAG: ABC transporter ATP-binding protein [Spartobacteria bacterium]|nr:ABC transporter ATP-binding protein [Spartobacteria bacterium]
MADSGKAPQAQIRLVDVRKTYTMGEVEVPVLRGIDAELYKGQFTVILGASGSGKSTLLNMIGGIDSPTSGEVWFDDRDVAQLSDRDLTEYRRTSVGFVFQFYNLVPSLTAYENVEVSTEVVDDPMDPREALEKVGLGDRIDHFPAQMSGGQQQRVAIARALAKNPKLMLCDEPTGALDHETSILVLNLLQKLNRDLGTTIVMITHAPPIAEMANWLIHIGDGKVVETKENKQPKTAEELNW